MLCEAMAGQKESSQSKPGIGEKVKAPVKQIAGREVMKAEKELAQCGNQVADV